MSHFGNVQLVEFLAAASARTDLDECPEGRPIVVLTVRPDPGSWRPHNVGLTLPQAERLKTDLEELLKAPVAFLLLAVLALASAGCAARVEVVTEKSAAAEAGSAEVPPAALEKRSVVVDVDFRGERQQGPAVPRVASERQATTPKPVPVNLGGIQLNGDGNTIEFHYHRHRRSDLPVVVYPVMRHEMVIVPGDGSAPVVSPDNAPPRVAVVDEHPRTTTGSTDRGHRRIFQNP